MVQSLIEREEEIDDGKMKCEEEIGSILLVHSLKSEVLATIVA